MIIFSIFPLQCVFINLKNKINKMKAGKEDSQKASTVKNYSLESSSKNKHFERKPDKIINTSSTMKTLKPNDLQSDVKTHYVPVKKHVKMDSIIQSTNKKTPFIINHEKNLQPTQRHKKTEKTDNKSFRGNKDSAQYYKYWKSKANEYQQSNFTLIRVNSALQQENEILKHRYNKLEKQTQKLKLGEFNITQSHSDFSKIEKFYKHQIDEDKKLISEQKSLISRQEKKIKQLSKYISENHQLKHILQNLQEKVNEISGSRQNSAQKYSQYNSLGVKAFSMTLSKNNKNGRSTDKFQYPFNSKKIEGGSEKKNWDYVFQDKLN